MEVVVVTREGDHAAHEDVVEQDHALAHLALELAGELAREAAAVGALEARHRALAAVAAHGPDVGVAAGLVRPVAGDVAAVLQAQVTLS